MNFYEVLPEIKKGAGYTREVWKDIERYVTMDEGEIVQVRPRKDFGGEPVGQPYKPGTGDMIAEDWLKVKDAPPQESDGTGNG